MTDEKYKVHSAEEGEDTKISSSPRKVNKIMCTEINHSFY
jgi:hypothetical protein